MVQYSPMEKEFLDFLLEEENLYHHQLNTLEKIKDQHAFSIQDLAPYQSMINKLGTHNMKTSSYRASFIVCQITRMINMFLNDLRMLLKEYTFPDKERILSLIDRLLGNTKEIIDAYYQVYGTLPYFRFYENWYAAERRRYLPDFNFHGFYAKLYPEKRGEEKLEDAIFRNLTTKDDGYDSTLFVPCSFQGTQGEYDQWLALQAYKQLKQSRTKPLALEDESHLPLSEKLLSKIRRGERW